jgi:putative ABC transport system substrate-binding protein
MKDLESLKTIAVLVDAEESKCTKLAPTPDELLKHRHVTAKSAYCNWTPDRRAFIGGVSVGFLAVQSHAIAQQPARVWRIGFLAATSRQFWHETGRYDAFLAALRELGYVEGKNLVVEGRFADGQYDRLPELALELVQLKVDVIVASPSPAIRAAQKATTTIPIVFPSTGDPVGSGFVATLARPGGNLTGMSNGNLDVSAKTLELLIAVLPRMSRIAVLANPGSSTESAMLKSFSAAAQTVGVKIVLVEAGTPNEIDAGFVTMKRERVDAVVIAGDALIGMQQRQVAELALQQRLPSISQGGSYARRGGLMGYGLNSTDAYRSAAVYVDKIFRGASPADLPVQQPTRLELVINMKTAQALGLTIPPSLLLRADEVIQ